MSMYSRAADPRRQRAARRAPRPAGANPCPDQHHDVGEELAAYRAGRRMGGPTGGPANCLMACADRLARSGRCAEAEVYVAMAETVMQQGRLSGVGGGMGNYIYDDEP